MEIKTTYGEIIRQGCWEDYCDMVGLDPQCLKKDPQFNDRNDEVTLTVQEADKLGIVGVMVDQIILKETGNDKII